VAVSPLLLFRASLALYALRAPLSPRRAPIPLSTAYSMRARFFPAAIVALTAALAACATEIPVAPVRPDAPLLERALSVPPVRIAELHYDNTGTDAGEAIEVSAPAGTDLTGWSLVLYNGSGGAVYNTAALSGVVTDVCSARGVVVVNYPVNGIQNGSPDGVALVDNNGTLVEFLSYEGTFTGVGGAANGVLSTDIGVSENGSEPVGQSLQRAADGTWSGPIAATFGSCNDGGTTPPAPVVATVTITPDGASLTVGATQALTAAASDSTGAPIPGTPFTWSSDTPAVATVNTSGLVTAVAEGSARVIAAAPNGVADTVTITVTAVPPPPPLPEVRFSELHYDNFGTDAGEAIEVEGPAGTDLSGWSIVLYNGNGGVAYNTTALVGTIPNLCSGRGVVFVTYPQDGIQNGAPDGLALVDNAGAVVEFLSYEGTMTATDGPAAGRLSVDIGVSQSSSPVGQSLQRDNAGVWQPPATSSFGACYGGVAPPPGNTITFSGRTSSDPALPVGYEDQLFATVRDGSGNIVNTTVTWTSETPAIASIDANGVVRALAVGTYTVRATAADGVTTATYSLDTQVATAGGTAQYGNNVEFGVPGDGDASDDVLVARAEFTSSWNPGRGIPNWVSYNLEATHIGSQDRCDCFTFDPALPSALPRYTTADYTGAGTFAGYGIDRGHLARSFDRSTGLLDNANTFYFSNIIPQAADNNQGPWAVLENFLGDEARFQNKEVYVIAGASGSKGTVKGEGKITIPAVTWKVAVIMDRDEGLTNVGAPSDITVIAVAMPNDPGIRNVPWQTYETTVDAVEALSGYDLLALLPDAIEIAVESKTSPPVAALDGPYTGAEGGAIAMSGAASTDPDGDALTYTWSFGDGSFGSGAAVSHTYAQDGAYTVQLIVADVRGLADTIATTATVANVAPAVLPLAGATLLPGEVYAEAGSFADPGSDGWSATVDFGDGSGVQPLSLSGKSFTLQRSYARAGSFTVRVTVSDDDASDSRTATVTVLTNQQAVANTLAALQQLHTAGTISTPVFNALRARLVAAQNALRSGQPRPAVQQLNNFLTLLSGYESAGQIPPADAASLRASVQRIIASLQRS
jgi:DNA/RNA endonuclease G (NUC1)